MEVASKFGSKFLFWEYNLIEENVSYEVKYAVHSIEKGAHSTVNSS